MKYFHEHSFLVMSFAFLVLVAAVGFLWVAVIKYFNKSGKDLAGDDFLE